MGALPDSADAEDFHKAPVPATVNAMVKKKVARTLNRPDRDFISGVSLSVARTVELFNLLLLALGVVLAADSGIGPKQIPANAHHLRSPFLRQLQLANSTCKILFCDKHLAQHHMCRSVGGI